MDTFKTHSEEIGHRIAVLGMVLNIDWDNEAELRVLAHDAINHAAATMSDAAVRKTAMVQHKAELFGLAALMLKNMQDSADRGFLTHGGASWKAFARALYLESERREQRIAAEKKQVGEDG